MNYNIIERILFYTLNIILALPFLFFRSIPEDSIFEFLGIFFIIGFTYIVYLKFTVFDFLYRRKNLPYTHKFLNKFLTDDKFFFIVVTGAIAVDVILNLIFPGVAPIFEGLKTTEDIPFRIFILLLCITSITFSYLGFWCIQQFKNFKNDFWTKNRLTGFKKLVVYKLFSPLIFSFCIVIIETLFFCSTSNSGLLPIIFTAFFVSGAIQTAINAVIIRSYKDKGKSVVLKGTRIFREIEIFIALFGLNCFLLFMEFYGCMAD